MQQALQEPELSEPGSLSLSESDLSEDDDKHLGTRKSSTFQNIKVSLVLKKHLEETYHPLLLTVHDE